MDNLTEFLKNFNIKFADDIHELLKCTICKNVLIDACVSACACKFCWRCIVDYLRDRGRPCPGAKDECKETILNTINELIMDPVSNMQITYLSAKCPNENCDHVCQLRRLPEHMRTCSKAAVECVFSYVGCVNGSITDDKMKEHLDDQSVAHSRALVVHMRNMENEIKQKIDHYEMALEKLTTENEIFRQMIQKNVTDIGGMKEEILSLSLKEEALTRENAALKGELETVLQSEEMVKMKQEVRFISLNQEILIKDNATFKEDLQASREDTAELRQRLDESERKQMDSNENMRHISDGHTAELIVMQEEIQTLLTTVDNERLKWSPADTELTRLPKVRKMDPDIILVEDDGVSGVNNSDASSFYGSNGFVWRIKRFGLECGVVEYSTPFLSDVTSGYKLCLCYQMNPSRGFWLTFYLMPGDDDDLLQWPMMRTVLIEIIDEQNDLPVVSRQVCLSTVQDRESPERRRLAYVRPSSITNIWGDGFVYCMTCEQIKSTSGAIRNGVMTVRCRVLP